MSSFIELIIDANSLYLFLVSLQWVYNILEHKAESERIIYENEHPEHGFLLTPDLKWDGKDTETLYLLAICNDRNIKSIRDLNSKHLLLLKNILNEGSVSAFTLVYKKFIGFVLIFIILESH